MVRTATPSRKRKERPPSSSPTASSPTSASAVAAASAASAAKSTGETTDRPTKKRTPNRRRRTSSKPMPKPSPRPTPTAHARRATPNASTNASSAGGGRGGTDDIPSVGNIVRGIGAGSSNGAVSSRASSSSGQGTVPPASNNSNSNSAGSGSHARERHGLLGLLPTRAERRNILESRAAEARARRRAEMQAEQDAADAERRARAGRGTGIFASAAEFAEREDSDDEEAEEEEGERDDERKKKGRNMTNNNHNHNEELADTSSDEEEGDGDRKKKKKASAATKSSSPPDVDVIANATAAGDEDGCSCAICFQTYPPEGLVTLPCCGVVPSSGDGAEGGGSEDNSRELSSTTRFCPTCMVTLATRTDNPQTAFVTIQRSPAGTTTPMPSSASSSTNAASNTSTNGRTDSSGSRNTTSTNSGGGSTFGRTHCRIGECPRCHHVLTVTNVRRNAHLDPSSSFSVIAVKGAHFSPEITAEFGWTVQNLRLEKAGLGEIVRYACGSGGGGMGGGIGGGAGGNQGQANANGQANVGNGGLGRRNGNANGNANGQAQRQQQQQQRMFQNQMMENIVDIVDAGGNAAALAANANGGAGRGAGRGAEAGRGGAAGRGGGGAARRPPRAAARNAQQAGAVNGTTGRYYGLFCFLAHTPSPDYIPADMVSLSTADEIFPKLVRWGILTEIRRTKVYALREPVATTQALIRDALPSVLFDPTLNDRARENAERLQNLEVLPGLAGLNTPQDMDAAVNLALISMNCMAKALICLLRLRPHMALWVVNQGLTTFWMALGVIPGRNGPPLAKWQRAVTFVMNMAFLYFALRGVFGILREALRSLPLAIIVVSLASAVLSKRPPHRMALDFALFYAYKRTKSTLGYASYLVLHTLWGHFMPKKWTSDCPYWVYGLLLAELFAGCYLYPDMPKFSLVASTHGMIYRVADSFAKAATESADKIALAMFGGPGLPASVFVQICPFVVILFMLHQGIKRFGKKYFVVIAAVSTAVLLAGAPR